MDEDKLAKLQERAKNNKIRSFNRSMANQQDKPQNRIRTALNTIRFSNRSGSYLNHFRYSPNNTDEHEDLKYEVFKRLRKLDRPVMVEPIFENGSRADLLDGLKLRIYEITHSETEEQLKEKIKSYPDIFEVIRIDTKEGIKEGDII